MEIKDISFAYQDKVMQLHNINRKINKGEITTIIRPNRSGKSTLLSVLTHNNHPQKGEVILSGKLLNNYKPKELAKTLGVVYEKNEAPIDMTVEKLDEYGRLTHRNKYIPKLNKYEDMTNREIERIR